MIANELAKLAAAVERQTADDGAHDTAVPALRLYRTSAPSDLTAVVYEPSLCIVAQGAKEVILAGEVYRYDPAHSLLVSVDLPGVSSKDVTIEVANGVLSVAAERPARAGGNSTKQKQQFVINERKVDTDKLQANLVDGVLTITLPKKEETKPTAITVAAQGPPEEQINTNENNKDTDTGVWQFTYDLPGVKAQDIQLEVHEDTLTLHATRHHHRNGGTSATTMDRKFSVDPTRVDTESMQGYLADGVLTLRGTRRPESAQTKVVVVPVSCGNTTTVSSSQIDAIQKQNDDSSGESLEQDDMVLVETVQAEDDDDDGAK